MSDHDNIVPFPTRDPHLSGHAQCLGCQHQWVAVAPIGTASLECPACGTLRGVWTHPIGLPVGSSRWTCVCGNDLFFIQPDATVCAACGMPTQPD